MCIVFLTRHVNSITLREYVILSSFAYSVSICSSNMGAGVDGAGVQHRGKSSLSYFHHWKKKNNTAAGYFAKQAVPVKFLPTADSAGSLSFKISFSISNMLLWKAAAHQSFQTCVRHTNCAFLFFMSTLLNYSNLKIHTRKIHLPLHCAV